MSTILQALRELEGKIAPPEVTAWTAEDRRWWWLGAAVAGAAILIAVAGAAFFFMHGRAAAPPGAPAPVAEAVPPALAAAPALKPVPQVPAPPVATPVPQAPTPPVANVVPQRPAAPPVATVVPSRPMAVPTPAPSPLPAPPAPNAARPETAARSSGEPRVQVSGIRYASSAPERVVTLAVDGGSPVTLHQGESTGDLEVQLILPDAVYVRRGGHVWMVSRDR